MNKILFIIFILLFSVQYSNSQNFNWINPNQTYLKLYVNSDGINRISRTDFTNAGITTTGLDPRTVKVFYKGQQIRIYFEGESDGTFDANDFFDFYGNRNYGGLTKYYNDLNVLMYTKDEWFNYYSDTSAYWVSWGGSNGLRFDTRNYTAGTQYSLSYFYDKVHSEKDLVYTQGERADEFDYRNFNNELFLGEGWYWAQLAASDYVTDNSVITPNISTATSTAYMKIFAYSKTKSTSIYNEHSVRMAVNGNSLPSVYCNDLSKIDTTITFSTTFLSGTSNNVRAFYEPSPGFVPYLYYDMCEISYPRMFKFTNNQLYINLSNADTASYLFKISGYASGNPVYIYDIKNNIRITNYSSNADTLIFTAKSNSILEVINKSITKKPFRISQRSVPDLVSTGNGADYLIIYNSLLESAADQLKNHRESFNGFRVYKAEISDIYDIFGYGMESPVGLKNFTKYVYENWQLPKMRFICLLGRGSTDPKKNLSTSVYYKNLVPTYGNPISDNYFSNFNFNSFTYYPQAAIGRLPAYTLAEANTMIDNIINYETQQYPSSWWKNFTFIVGGSSTIEQQYFQALMNPLINNHIVPPPISGNPHRIFKNDTSTAATFNYKDSVRRDLNNGTMIVNFIGHAGFDNWEDALEDPATLDNYYKLPLVFSMTCYTGKSCEGDKRGFGEKFVTMSNKGAIGFVGTGGWGFTFSQSVFQDSMFRAIKNDTIRYLGEITKYAATKIKKDSGLTSFLHTINCYMLQGDPAVSLAFPRQPEFSITGSEYRFSNDFPELNEPVTMTVYPKNFGLHADSCKIRFTLKKDNISYGVKDTVLRNFKYSDSVKYNFKLDSLDDYAVDVALDYDNWYSLDDPTNNNISVVIGMKNISYIPIKPVDNSVVKVSSVEFSGLNPIANRKNNAVKVILQFDTSKNFNSSLLTTFINKTVTGAVSKFNTNLPVTIQNTVYYWRTNAVINNDSSGWSKTQVFTYNNTLTESAAKEGDNIIDTNVITLYKSKEMQFPQYDLYNSYFAPASNGIALSPYTWTLLSRSHGSNGAEVSYFNVNDKGIYIDNGRSTGLNLLKVKRLNGSIIEFKNFKLLVSQSSDSIINFLNTFDTTYYLMGLNASYVQGASPMSTAAKNKIKTFGSTKIDSIPVFGQFDTWSFIGYLGATGANVQEQIYRYTSPTYTWTPSIVSSNKNFKKTSGTVTNIIGPAQSWNDFSWTHTLYPQSTVLFDVYGIDKNGVQSLLLSNQSTNNLVNLSSINAYTYPKLNLLTKISIDTNTGDLSSVLNSLKAHYSPTAELMLDNNSMSLSDTIVKMGQDIKINFDYYNAGYVSVPGVIVNIYKNSVSSQNLVRSDTIAKELKADSSLNYLEKFTVPYARLNTNNRVAFYAEIMPIGQYNEIYTYNNTTAFSLYLKNIVGNSQVNLYSDGQIVKSGDYVRSNPELKIEIQNTSSELEMYSDTSQIVLKVNDNYISNIANNNDGDRKISSKVNISGDDENTKVILYTPELKEGVNNLKIIYRNGSDAIDTVEYDLIVSDELLVKDFYNYPNPMKSETSFIFNLAGSEIPGNCKIRIYAVSGRLIREIDVVPVIGFNQIDWDGKDSDGDFIANGTYLYKLVAEDDSKTETSTQKLVILR